jgi:hypothetical protein
MKTPKKYPMNGPNLRIQAIMQNPAAHRDELKAWAKANPTQRPETLAAIAKLR